MPELAVNTLKKARILRGAIDRKGRFDAAKLALLLDWQNSDIARYLGRAPSTISRFGASPVHQEKLASLASLAQDVLRLTNDDIRAARAWFRIPLRALDDVSPREAILRDHFRRVRELVNEMDSGLAF